MKKFCPFTQTALSACLFIIFLTVSNTCFSQAAEKGEKNIPQLQYAPDRTVDIEHIIIDVTPDFNNSSIDGTTTIKFTPIAKPLTELKLDACDLTVSSVTSGAKIAGYNVTRENIIITFVPPVEAGIDTSVTIKYLACPKEGMFFRTAKNGYKAGDIHLFSQGEAETNRCWYPSYDYPNERFSSEIICHVPADYTVLANGRLISEQFEPEKGLKAVRWLQKKPHVNYLIALVAGKFEKVESKHRNIPLAFYTTPSNIEYAQSSFKDTENIMDFFEKEISVNYPWDKYYQVCVKDFTAGGMENTSLTVLNESTLFSDGFETLRSSEMLVSHEMAHQWFGDYVTCKDWSHLWLNEGFATYYQQLYDGYKNGKDQMLYSLYRTAQSITARTDEQIPIVTRAYHDPDEQFNYRNYGKGGWVLHMLRCQLGEDLYRKCVKTYLERYGLSSTVTEDFVSIVEELSGGSYERFFDQWVRLGRFPELEISCNWSEKDGLEKVSIRQEQKPLNNISTYYLPAKIRFIVDGKKIDKEVTVDSKEHDFYFAIPGKPAIVRFDPNYTLLAKINFEISKDMLYAQLENSDDCIGRILAIEQLSKKDDNTTIEKLKNVLNNDSFYGVRIEASKALRKIGTDDAFSALCDSIKQPEARVRAQVINDIGSIYRQESLEALLTTIENEKNPGIIADCIRDLGLYHGDKTREILIKYLASESFRNILADAAIDAVRKLDDPCFTDPLKKTIETRQDQLETRTLSNALDTLGYLSREKEDKSDIRQFLVKYVENKNRFIKTAAIRALGNLGDQSARAILETFVSEDDHYTNFPRRRLDGNYAHAAKIALEKLNKEEKLAPAEVTELREKVNELKKETDKFKTDIEDLKKKFSARGSAEEKITAPADANGPSDANAPVDKSKQ
jgi:aminopeptidase N